MQVRDKIYIDGAWVPSAGTSTINVINSTTEEVMGTIPEGSAGLVVPRSGLAARHGIAIVNAPGLIDSGYRGEVRVLLLNTDKREAFAIEPGDRIAQLVIAAIGDAEPEEADSLAESARGEGGFGSSGRR